MESSEHLDRVNGIAAQLRTTSDGCGSYDVQVIEENDGEWIIAPLLPIDDRCGHCRCGSVRLDVLNRGIVVTITGDEPLDGSRSRPLPDAAEVLKFVREQGWGWCSEDSTNGDHERLERAVALLNDVAQGEYEEEPRVQLAWALLDEIAHPGKGTLPTPVVEAFLSTYATMLDQERAR